MKYILIIIVGLAGNASTFSAERPIGVIFEKIEFSTKESCEKAAKILIENGRKSAGWGLPNFYQAVCIEKPDREARTGPERQE